MRKKQPVFYQIRRVFLDEITVEEILLHILYRSSLTEKSQND